MSLLRRLGDLDDRVLGRQEPDDRPLVERLLRPVSTVRTRLGRLTYFGLVAGMFANLRWGSDGTASLVIFVGLMAASLVVVVLDSRHYSRRRRRSDSG